MKTFVSALLAALLFVVMANADSHKIEQKHTGTGYIETVLDAITLADNSAIDSTLVFDLSKYTSLKATFQAYSDSDSVAQKAYLLVGVTEENPDTTGIVNTDYWSFTKVDSLTITTAGVKAWDITLPTDSFYTHGYVLFAGQADNSTSGARKIRIYRK